jgi:hypothetical protein
MASTFVPLLERMSNPSPSNPIQPLSVGNVVSAGVRIYRSHLQRYLTMSLIAYLWLLVPIYGWAKYAEISARISRLAFQELINKPESNAEAAEQTRPRLWSFLVAGLLVGLIYIGLYLGFVIALVILGGISGALMALVPALGVIGILLTTVAFFAGLYGFIRLIARLLIVEVPLATEDSMDATTAISRSWNLTKGSVGRIQWIVIVAFLISLLINIPAQIIGAVLPIGPDAEPAVVALSLVVLFAVSILSGALIMPFWQVIKAVIYYDVRARREGFGLQLRDQ